MVSDFVFFVLEYPRCVVIMQRKGIQKYPDLERRVPEAREKERAHIRVEKQQLVDK